MERRRRVLCMPVGGARCQVEFNPSMEAKPVEKSQSARPLSRIEGQVGGSMQERDRKPLASNCKFKSGATGASRSEINRQLGDKAHMKTPGAWSERGRVRALYLTTTVITRED